MNKEELINFINSIDFELITNLEITYCKKLKNLILMFFNPICLYTVFFNVSIKNIAKNCYGDIFKLVQYF